MKFIQKNWQKLILILMFFMFLVPGISFAGDTDIDPCVPSSGKICNPLASRGINSLQGFIKTLVEGVLKIGIPIVALAIIYSGFLFVAARGNPEKLKKAKESLMYTLIGAAILLGSWAIAQLIAATVTGLGTGV